MAPKRKVSSTTASQIETPPRLKHETPVPLPANVQMASVPSPPSRPTRRASQRVAAKIPEILANPDVNGEIIDGGDAARASPDSDINTEIAPTAVNGREDSDSPLSDISEVEPPPAKKRATPAKKKAAASAKSEGSVETPVKPSPVRAEKVNGIEALSDPEAEGEEVVDEEDLKQALARPPPVNSDYLPLPWKGRIGYACLNTYLRFSNPPVFCSRTCRIASILEHRHPLKDPSQPEHATKNRPDKEQPADIARGQAYVEAIGLANARDLIKMLRWNDRYNIKFMRLSSEMFPFASHKEYGYKLAPFASDVLAEVGKVVAELGHRVTTHPGQFTQLGSPHQKVIEDSFRDLEYHSELLSLLKLPPQQDRDAVMILHMGGVFGDKAATLDRFRQNYAKLSQSVKNRLVLENDDMSWSVHDLLPICKELNIPMVLDYHHHNIIFDSSKIREGTKEIIDLYDEISETWKRKGIKQKMHYSEPTPAAITGTQRRKHSPRVATLPPCSPDMDLMIEAKDKEQAVFELMRIFKLPGFDTFNDIIPHTRKDDNKPVKAPKKKAAPKKKGKKAKEEEVLDAVAEDLEAEAEAEAEAKIIPEEEVGMGGPEGRVYWPPGMEEWLRPKKREVNKKEPGEPKATPAKRKRLEEETKEESPKDAENGVVKQAKASKVRKPPTKKAAGKVLDSKVTKKMESVPMPETSDEDGEEDFEGHDEDKPTKPAPKGTMAPTRKSARSTRVSYAEADHSEVE